MSSVKDEAIATTATAVNPSSPNLSQSTSQLRQRTPVLGGGNSPRTSPSIASQDGSSVFPSSISDNATIVYNPKSPNTDDAQSLFTQTEELLIKRSPLSSSVLSVEQLHQRQQERKSLALDIPTISITSSDDSEILLREADPPPVPSDNSPLLQQQQKTVGEAQNTMIADFSREQDDDGASDTSRRSSLLSRSITNSSIKSARSAMHSSPVFRDCATQVVRSWTISGRASRQSARGPPDFDLKLTRKFPLPFAIPRHILLPESSDGIAHSSDKGKWTASKYFLLSTVILLFAYGVLGLVIVLRVWFNTWQNARIALICNSGLLTSLTLASIACILTAVLGLMGVLLNHRRFLAFYALFLWPDFLLILIVGYSAYHKATFSLDLKLNQAWSQAYSDLDRLRIQNMVYILLTYALVYGHALYLPFNADDATYSQHCFPRSMLPGCKMKLYVFQRDFLHQYYILAFGIVPFHMYNICVAVVCANHINRKIGKGYTPAAYRLTPQSVDDCIAKFRLEVHRETYKDNDSIIYMPRSSPDFGLKGLGLEAS